MNVPGILEAKADTFLCREAVCLWKNKCNLIYLNVFVSWKLENLHYKRIYCLMYCVPHLWSVNIISVQVSRYKEFYGNKAFKIMQKIVFSCF